MFMLGSRQVNTVSVLLLCTVEVQYSLHHPEYVCLGGGGWEMSELPGNPDHRAGSVWYKYHTTVITQR